MAKLSYKLSYYVLYVLFALILIVLGMFFFVGYNNPVGEYNDPKNTNLLIYLMYGMIGFCVAVSVIAAIAQFGASLKDNPKNAMKSLIGIICLIAVVVIAWSMGSDAAVLTGDGLYTDTFWLKITDMFIYSIYILMGIAALGILVNLTGIFKR